MNEEILIELGVVSEETMGLPGPTCEDFGDPIATGSNVLDPRDCV